MDSPLYIFDAGGTKTDLAFRLPSKSTYITHLSGFNPNRSTTNFISDLEALAIPSNAIVHFYGSGLKSAERQNELKELFDVESIEVYSDLQGAVRACNQSKGIVAILGTGSIVTYFENDIIIKTRGGYGYLIDDLGGGLELGKTVISHWLNDDLSANTSKGIEKKLGIKKERFTVEFYKTKRLKMISDLCSILMDLARNDEALDQVISDYFDAFISKHVLPLTEAYQLHSFSTVGSIGKYFKTYLSGSAQKHGIKIDFNIEKPIEKLLEYHIK